MFIFWNGWGSTRGIPATRALWCFPAQSRIDTSCETYLNRTMSPQSTSRHRRLLDRAWYCPVASDEPRRLSSCMATTRPTDCPFLWSTAAWSPLALIDCRLQSRRSECVRWPSAAETRRGGGGGTAGPMSSWIWWISWRGGSRERERARLRRRDKLMVILHPCPFYISYLQLDKDSGPHVLAGYLHFNPWSLYQLCNCFDYTECRSLLCHYKQKKLASTNIYVCKLI